MADYILGIIGCGNMAEAIVANLLSSATLAATSIVVSDRDPDKVNGFITRFGVRAASDNRDLVAQSDVVLFAMKPQDAPALFADVAPLFFANRVTAVSIAAGIPIAAIERHLGDVTPVIRVMPNTPIRIGLGASVCMANAAATAEERDRAAALFKAGGICLFVDDESHFDAVTALSGSGPAYVFAFIEALQAAAQTLGLPEDLILPLVYQTLEGAVFLAKRGPGTPEELRRQVTSKGGTTEAALRVFDDRGFQDIVREALTAASRRSRDLSDVLSKGSAS